MASQGQFRVPQGPSKPPTCGTPYAARPDAFAVPIAFPSPSPAGSPSPGLASSRWATSPPANLSGERVAVNTNGGNLRSQTLRAAHGSGYAEAYDRPEVYAVKTQRPVWPTPGLDQSIHAPPRLDNKEVALRNDTVATPASDGKLDNSKETSCEETEAPLDNDNESAYEFDGTVVQDSDDNSDHSVVSATSPFRKPVANDEMTAEQALRVQSMIQSTLQRNVNTPQSEDKAKDRTIRAQNLEIEAKERRIVTLLRMNRSKRANISDLSKDIMANKSEVSKLERQISDNNDTIMGLQMQIIDLNADMHAKSSHIADLEAEIRSNKTHITNLELGISQKDSLNSDLKAENKDLQFKCDINTKTEAMLRNIIREKDNKISNTETDKKGLYSVIRENGKKIKQLEEENDANDSQIMHLKQENAEIQKNLKDGLSSKARQIALLNSVNADLKQENVRLSQENTSLKQINATILQLQQTIDEQNRRLTSIANDQVAKDVTIENQNSAIQQLQCEIALLKAPETTKPGYLKMFCSKFRTLLPIFLIMITVTCVAGIVSLFGPKLQDPVQCSSVASTLFSFRSCAIEVPAPPIIWTPSGPNAPICQNDEPPYPELPIDPWAYTCHPSEVPDVPVPDVTIPPADAVTALSFVPRARRRTSAVLGSVLISLVDTPTKVAAWTAGPFTVARILHQRMLDVRIANMGVRVPRIPLVPRPPLVTFA